MPTRLWMQTYNLCRILPPYVIYSPRSALSPSVSFTWSCKAPPCCPSHDDLSVAVAGSRHQIRAVNLAQPHWNPFKVLNCGVECAWGLRFKVKLVPGDKLRKVGFSPCRVIASSSFVCMTGLIVVGFWAVNLTFNCSPNSVRYLLDRCNKAAWQRS